MSFSACLLLVDGVPLPEARLELEALGGWRFGEGLFETLLLVGGRPLFLERHLNRLLSAQEELGLGASTREAWLEDLRTLGDLAPEGALALRLILLKDGTLWRRILLAGPVPKRRPGPLRLGAAARLFQGARSLASFKTLNHLQPLLARREGARRGLDEVYLHQRDGTLLEGASSSIFLVRGGKLLTPALDLPLLAGVTREVLLSVARRAGLPVEEGRFFISDLIEADEVLLASSLMGVRPAGEVDGTLKVGAPGPVTRVLMGLYGRLTGVAKETP